MNSLSELNQHNQDFVLNYTDERPAQIVFSRTVPVNVSSSALQGYNTELTLGIDILDIVQGETLDIKLEVDLSSISLASLTWDTIPSGCTATQIGNKYIMSGITTLAQWKLINSPSIIVNMYNDGSYSYNASIKYQLTGDKSWSVSLRISQGARLNSNYNFFADSQRLIAPTFYYDSFFDLQTFGGRVRFGTGTVNVTSNYNIASSYNRIRSDIFNMGSNYDLYCYPIKPLVSKFNMNIANILDSYYLLDSVRTADTYQTNTTTTISGGSLISHDYPTFEGQLHTFDIIPSDINAVSNLNLTNYIFKQKILSNDVIASSGFGSIVSISTDGNTLAISIPQQQFTNDLGTSTGSVYIFTKINNIWTYQSKLQSNNTSAYDGFAQSISLSGDGNTLAVGALQDDNSGGSNAGSCYIFTRSGTTWSEQTRLQASNAAVNDYFGCSVSLSYDGNTLAVGASQTNTTSIDAGSCYIFNRSGITWTQYIELQASDASTVDYFGYVVRLSGDGNTLIVGCQTNRFVYVFTKNNSIWTEETKLQPVDTIATDQFGRSIALSFDGTIAAIGSPLDDTSLGFDNHGSVYMYTKIDNIWSYIKLDHQISPIYDGENFGNSVSLSNDGSILAIGASGYHNSDYVGGCYLYYKDNNNWIKRSLITANDAAYDDRFGTSVALSGNGVDVIIGSPRDDNSNGTDSGSCYFYNNINYAFNNTTKVLTLTGLKNDINTLIDTIQYTPATGYTSNFTLQYRYYEPGSTTKYVYRTQNITHV